MAAERHASEAQVAGAKDKEAVERLMRVVQVQFGTERTCLFGYFVTFFRSRLPNMSRPHKIVLCFFSVALRFTFLLPATCQAGKTLIRVEADMQHAQNGSRCSARVNAWRVQHPAPSGIVFVKFVEWHIEY